ncbi:MAG: phospholipase D-like domain-containing protein, partial [Flavisolibacter sp.]
ILSNLEFIIESANKKLVLISYSLKIPANFQGKILQAAKRGVAIKVFHATEVSMDTIHFLQLVPNIEVYHFQDLHAKCFFNEDSMIIGSMNFYDFSSKNIEAGILINKKEESEVFDACINEVQALMQVSTKLNFDIVSDEFIDFEDLNPILEAHCIRCRRPVDYDPDRPLCYECYSKWSETSRWDYREQYCHECGGSFPTSRGKPLCNICY